MLHALYSYKTINIFYLQVGNLAARSTGGLQLICSRGYANGGNIITLKCLSIGTPKTINFPFVPNGKLIDFRCPNI